MSKIYRTESQDDYRQRPIQNFPDYLKYVAKKSKAGFGKVHDELYRIYLESFSSTDKAVDKSAPQPCVNQRVETIDNETDKSKRKRWSRRSGLFWSSTGQETPIGNSFVSYITEEREDLLSSSSSKGDFDVLSDELDVIKHENHALHNDGICSAGVYDKDRSRFDFDGFCMPHTELTNELIYANDRVLREEKITTLSKDEENAEEMYSMPALKYTQQQSYEKDDYVNLRAPYKDMGNARIIEVQSTKNFNVADKQDSTDSNDKKIIPQSERSNDGEDDDDDDDYLPPTHWTQSCCLPSTNEKCSVHLYAKVAKKRISAGEKPFSVMSKSKVGNSNTLARTPVKEGNDIETDSSDYLLPSKLVDPDYENVPCENKTTPLYINIGNKSSFTKEKDLEIQSVKSQDYTEGVEALYDRPNTRSRYGNCPAVDCTDNSDKEAKDNQVGNDHSDKYNRSENMVMESTDDLYSNIVRDNTENSFEGEYSVPTGTKLVTLKYNVSDEISSEREGDYSVPKWPKPLDVINNSKHDPKQKVYATPTSDSDKHIYSTILTHNNDKTESSDANLKSSGEKDVADFYNYTVDEVVECLTYCALNKLAEICKEKQLDGDFFRSLTTDDLKGEPYHMNWFYISKLFKVISGWRPKRSFKK